MRRNPSRSGIRERAIVGVFVTIDGTRIVHLLHDGTIFSLPAKVYDRLPSRRPDWKNLLRLGAVIASILRLVVAIASHRG